MLNFKNQIRSVSIVNLKYPNLKHSFCGGGSIFLCFTKDRGEGVQEAIIEDYG